MRKHYLKHKMPVRLCIIACALATVFWLGNTKAGVFFAVKYNQESLTQFAEGLIRSGEPIANVHYCTWKVYKHTTHVDFIVTEFGLAPSTVYKGFYYSPSDSLVGFQGANHVFSEYDDGWIYREDNGDNVEYLEKIADNWYWFEMYF